MQRSAIVLFSIVAAYVAYPTLSDHFSAQPDRYQNKCTAHITHARQDPYFTPRPTEKINIVKLTNSGEFVDRCELTDALADIGWDSSLSWLPRSDKARAGLPKLVVLYVHGWLHDSDADDENLREFTGLVERLRADNRGKKNVVGVYVGWNASWGPAPIAFLSFWSKELIADRIAQSAVVTKIVSAINAMLERDKALPDQFVAIGHSFGARILFSATSQALVAEAERAHPGHSKGQYRIVEGLADSLILLNPAFAAARYTALDDVTRNEEAFSDRQLPVSFIISTENDWANKVAFPIGKWLGAERSDKEMTTVGNFSPYQTHALLRGLNSGCTESDNSKISERFFQEGLCLQRIPNKAYDGDRARPKLQQFNPFIVARTTADVIDGHGGIWSREFSNWLFLLVNSLGARRNARTNLLDAQASDGSSK
ncbi:hypothetical protein [Methylocystis sp.]|uniref:hypothetical protein n=1 Tax=Methylocystis sp. TaxID=1911079 RepID=UPI003DA6AD50